MITADRSQSRRSRVRPRPDRSRRVTRLAVHRRRPRDVLRTTYGHGDTAVEALAWVDVSLARGAFTAMSWLSGHGSNPGLCKIYANEASRYELSVEPGAVSPSQQDSAVSR